jgi:hypothetical protein
MEKASVFYGHLECFTAIWYTLWPFGTLCVHLVHFFGLKKSGNPACSNYVNEEQKAQKASRM